MKSPPIPFVASNRSGVDAAKLARANGARSAYVVFDRAVRSRAGAIEDALAKAGIDVLGRSAIAGGERSKRMRSVEKIHTDLVAVGADRATLVIAVGGGTVTDVAGFAAATYMRGVPWLPVATTVLGMVDAAIGGKTGVDLPQGKNLVGAFWQPIGAIADLAALETLPVRERRTGMAEIVKHAIVGDAGLLRVCETFDPGSRSAEWISLVRRAAGVKLRVVRRDPRETGVRATLNLGHTVGHAIEQASGFRISHGAAVAVGLRAAGLLALRRGMWSAVAHARVLGALAQAGLAVNVEGVSSSEALSAMRRDKKRANGSHRFVLPRRLGYVVPGIEVTEREIRWVLSQCSRPPSASERGG
jgi:shikimate kinase/3-dehydroquinate synthase